MSNPNGLVLVKAHAETFSTHHFQLGNEKFPVFLKLIVEFLKFFLWGQRWGWGGGV
jgi:hypothetical protein